MTLSDTTTSSTKSLTAVIVAHNSPVEAINAQLLAQEYPPDEIILVACCMDTHGIPADIIVNNTHRDDFGHLARDIGLRLATKDYVMFAACDDEYDPKFTKTLLDANVQFAWCDWHEQGRIVESYVGLGSITSGNFIVETKLAQEVGWNHREYIADGKFCQDVWDRKPTFARIQEPLYTHR